MFSRTIEYLARERDKERLADAEQHRLAKIAARRQRSLTMLQNWKLGLVVFLIKGGLLIVLLTLATFLTAGA
jgi:hypothetical protein